MKARKIFLALTAFVISASAYSQTDSTKRDTTTAITQQANQETTTNKTDINSAQTNRTSATDIAVPKPNHGRYYTPVLGTYHQDASAPATTTATTKTEATPAEAKTVSITPDEENPGKVWVEGLTETRFYALLKAVPGTYKIPAQNHDDKPVAEGEIQYDETNKSISICVGCGFQQKATVEEQAPVVTSTAKNTKTVKSVKKAKTTIINFTGTKTDTGSVSIR